jgi:hypothetical protein
MIEALELLFQGRIKVGTKLSQNDSTYTPGLKQIKYLNNVVEQDH